MGPFALILAGVAVWLWWTGKLKRITSRDGMAIGMGLIGALLLIKGKPLAGLAPMILTGLYALWRLRPPVTTRRIEPVSVDIVEARAILGVDENADPDAIRAAHRRLITLMHPDRGGTEALARKINTARDLLLRHYTEKQRPPGRD
ncbi:MAG: DnaJ domain-containing protein [Alphaproteobacteria bacterium]|nr:DnaJ domain-containing protein [Alphaproteobacteria bacterium]